MPLLEEHRAAIPIDPDRSTTTEVMLCKKTRVLIEIEIE